ncbi:conserved hypothetical protein [Trichormus variabilis ATCC 29413]|uniref:Lipoprotein n=2 Tax=Anabaena variabilis TaxID=264691 RepID=Q3M7A9_TRIV2|nr:MULTISPECIES: hypothetical protein [Nostocaceae]ABA23127.1 conserved hypothetical protein [Trichormus variabilis ATCC 29413]MBC1217389.1 hypothetical protein [Trichormus variabilis ARAD]MBC1257714.1 hypothetical protein [Trichormus variabilis V5]MBC1270067.1 hypothetical protein [Trichormus variabilis FSR]MBC1303226.1 hypothetical protein [Trichormus variabilis N2B]
MRANILGFGIIFFLSGCTTNIDSNSQAANNINAKIENCPQAQVVSLPAPNKDEGFYDRFDFHIRNIVADGDTVKFQTLKQDFVFCRGNNNWTVQSGTLPKELQPENNYATFAQELVNPKFKNIDFQGKTYQYRVARQPQFTLGENNNISRPDVTDPAKDAVVFELINPNNQNTQRQTLYTLKDLQEIAVKAGYSAAGNQLGFPQITSASVYNDRVWWSVAFEQGEGNNGIATIISYDPKTDKFNIIQPEALWFTQITDLAITGNPNNPTFWVGTNISGEGNLYIPSQGLVAYRPDSQNPNRGSLTAYTVNNSPIVGAIPDKLRLENDKLWVSTANGVCQVKWETADNPESWNCWRFATMTKLPQQLPIYSALTNKTPVASLSSGDDIEVLWWSPVNYQTQKGRYEVRYSPGFTVELEEGASTYQFPRSLSPGKISVDWPGVEWNWNGERFVRGFDEVSLNLSGGGPRGIGSGQLQPEVPINWNTMRGDLELLDLSTKSTKVKYYSGWVDDTALKPYLTVISQTRPQNPQPNPLAAVAKQLPSRQ